ncbi:pyridoxal phosphate-dependent aminotransferase family protein [Dyadobacter frigoris]|uniref:Pyridoxal phosphate-dependent aminotransferase family protein n=1 Tax=Dyadobacter frigoris TaxID=2576211 RepID=A0A4U6DBA1_9BACT|nr:pyridoxal phosphate-dependent aminotransferase family protein [Dyadobacter frigoris]TKT93741.1 pyridoxal phosphate-dependent aminotransferase family protein [Dyadobacter frigoris]GLU51047.1 8-amino-7-oxononanoate synthase [Dyadobacter frigoris]
MKIYPTSHLPGRKVLLNNGKEYLYFSGTDYLGMGHHYEFLTYLKEGISIYGTHFGSSRNNSLRLEVYEEAETALANFSGAPAALTTSSGMWAGQLLMKVLPKIITTDLQDKNFHTSNIHYHYAPRVHPALWGVEYISASSGWEDWAKDTILTIQESNVDCGHIICSDSVGSPFVESFDFSIFKTLPFYREIYLIVDDSHGLGVLGKNGGGIFRELSSIQQVKLIVSSSLNKALGIPSGVIFGNHDIIDTIRKSPFFAGASPAPPAYIYALNKLLESNTYPVAHQQLLDNINYIAGKLTETNLFVSTPDYPVFCSSNNKLFDFLEENGIMASCFSYPQPTDPPVTRIVISAIHQKEDLGQLAEVCMKF